MSPMTIVIVWLALSVLATVFRLLGIISWAWWVVLAPLWVVLVSAGGLMTVIWVLAYLSTCSFRRGLLVRSVQ